MPTPPDGTAIVFGGGGSAGNAWLIGVVAGLLEAGVDVTAADLIVGTSAGSTAAAQVTAARPAELFAGILASAPPSRPARPAGPAPAGPDRRPLASSHLERLDATIAASTGVADLRRRIAAVLLEDPASHGELQTQWRTTVAARLRSPHWPSGRLLITAVDARTGEPVVFDRESGVELVDAVAASCAGGFAYRIGEEWYIDGGYRLNADNADLAAGYARVLVLSPLGGGARTPAAWGTHLSTQLDGLRAQGSAVETILPDEDALAAFGENLMNPVTRRPAARAGHAQGRARAVQLAGFFD